MSIFDEKMSFINKAINYTTTGLMFIIVWGLAIQQLVNLGMNLMVSGVCMSEVVICYIRNVHKVTNIFWIPLIIGLIISFIHNFDLDLIPKKNPIYNIISIMLWVIAVLLLFAMNPDIDFFINSFKEFFVPTLILFIYIAIIPINELTNYRYIKKHTA